MGSLYKNGIYWYFGYNKNGEQVCFSTGIKGDLADKRKKEIKKQLERQYEFKNLSRRFSPKLDHIIHDYLEKKEKEVNRRQRSQNTLNSDRQHLKTFKNYIRNTYGRLDIKDVNSDILEKYMEYRYDIDGCNNTTVGNNIRGIMGFLKYCVNKNHIDINPTTELEIPKPNKRTKDQIPTEDEFDKIRNYLNNYIVEYLNGQSSYSWIKLICWYQVRTGMRCGEVLIMKWNQDKKLDIGEDHSFSYVYLNNQKTKLVIYFKKKLRGISIKEQLHDVSKKIEKETKTDSYVFENESTNTFFDNTSISRPFKKLLTEIGVDSKYTPHTLRHGFITDLLRKNKNIYKIGKLVGHSTARITELYGHLISSDLEELMYD